MVWIEFQGRTDLCRLFLKPFTFERFKAGLIYKRPVGEPFEVDAVVEEGKEET